MTTANAKLAVAVVGAGVIGRTHIETIGKSDVARLAAVVDPTDAGQAIAESVGARWFATHADLINAKACDAAIVATPNAMHLGHALDFIAARIPVLVEKPVTVTVNDAQALVDAAAQAKVPVLVGHHRRHNPIIARARAVIASGVLGRLTTATVMYTFLKPAPYFDLMWRRDPAAGGPVLINLIHEIDLVRHLLGEIESLQAITSNGVRGFAVEDTVAVMVRMVSGALVTISLSDAVTAPWSWDLAVRESALYPPQPRQVQTHFICGTEGSLSLPDCTLWSYVGEKSWFAPITPEALKVGNNNPYMLQLAHFCQVARGEAAPLCSAADGAATLAATLAVREAAVTGRAVVLGKFAASAPNTFPQGL
jgi:predicted dehydrogenase